jgi:excisionase family DNA binding protein
MSDQLLTVRQAAARMGRSIPWIHHLIKEERLPAIRPGSEYLIKASDVDSFEHQPRGKPSTQAKEAIKKKLPAAKKKSANGKR